MSGVCPVSVIEAGLLVRDEFRRASSPVGQDGKNALHLKGTVRIKLALNSPDTRFLDSRRLKKLRSSKRLSPERYGPSCDAANLFPRAAAEYL